MKKPILSNERAKAQGLKRARKLKLLLDAGMSLTEIGKGRGEGGKDISRQRVKQLIDKLS